MSKETLFYTVLFVATLILLWFVGASFVPLKNFYNFLVGQIQVIPYILLILSPIFYLASNTRLAWILLGVAFIGFLAFGVIPLSFVKI